MLRMVILTFVDSRFVVNRRSIYCSHLNYYSYYYRHKVSVKYPLAIVRRPSIVLNLIAIDNIADTVFRPSVLCPLLCPSEAFTYLFPQIRRYYITT